MVKINKIQLENVATHVNNTVVFKDGINILAGQNGAGKTTVLRMIGYVLFNHPSTSMSRFIRNGQGRGAVTLWITGVDGHEYRLQRTIGEGKGGYFVRDETEGMTLRDASKAEGYKQVVRAITGLFDVEPADIFKHAIGVDQGTFTAPFMQSPIVRRKIFAPLLSVDAYEKSYGHFRAVETLFDEEINSLRQEVARLDGELAHKAAVENDVASLRDGVAALGKSLQATKAKLSKVTTEHATLAGIKASIEKLSHTIALRDTEARRLDAAIGDLQEELRVATGAAERCKVTEADHALHETTQAGMKALDEAHARYQVAVGERKGLEADIAGKKRALQRIDADIAGITRDAAALPGLQRDHETFERFTVELENANRLQARLRDLRARVHDLSARIAGLEAKTREKAPSESRLRALQEEVQDLDAIARELDTRKADLRVKQDQLERARRNKELSADGTCPLLHERCSNIKGASLADHFQAEIDEADNAISALTPVVTGLEEQIKAGKRALEEIKEIESGMVLVNAWRDQIEHTRMEKDALDQEIESNSGIQDTIRSLQRDRDAARPGHERYMVVKNAVDTRLPALQAERERSVADLDGTAVILAGINERISSLADVPARREQALAVLERTRRAHDEYIHNRQLAGKLPAIEKALIEKTSENERVASDAANLREKVCVLERSFDDGAFTIVERRKDDLTRTQGSLAGQLAEKEASLRKAETALAGLRAVEQEASARRADLESALEVKEFAGFLRASLRGAGPLVTRALMERINNQARHNLRDLMDDPSISITWENDFSIKLDTSVGEKVFDQLSGGEQMACALAVRLAILRVMGGVDFAFFDEPTTNLDAGKRENLARCIGRVSGFKQLFVISHEDTFEAMGDFVIRFIKEGDEETRVEYMHEGAST